MSNSNGASRLLVAAALCALGVAAQTVRAEDYVSPTDERVRLSLGAMYVSTSTSIQADSSAGVTGTNFNAEDEFGLSKNNWEPKFQAMFRVDTRQRLSFDYFTLDRSGNEVLANGPLVFRDVVFLTGDPMQSQLSLRTYGLTYGYSFWHSPTVEVAGTIGVHETDISALVKVETQTRHIIQTDDQAGPVPTVGIDATWVVSKRWYLDARAQYLDVHVHNLSGSFGIFDFDVLYRLRANIAFGLGYWDLQAHLTSTQTNQGGLFDFSTKGPEMFFRASF